MAKTRGDQNIYTPDALALSIVSYFNPKGKILEPCKGGGAFTKAMSGCDWCEITEGRDFLKAEGHWDWIVTNPPFGQVPAFLDKAMDVADNIVFLCWTNIFFTKARQSAMRSKGFELSEILFVNTPPKPWPQSGFCVSANLVKRGAGSEIATHLMVERHPKLS